MKLCKCFALAVLSKRARKYPPLGSVMVIEALIEEKNERFPGTFGVVIKSNLTMK